MSWSSGLFVPNLDMDMRFTLCNMNTETGAMTEYIQRDDVTWAHVRGCSTTSFKTFKTDADYEYDADHEFDVSELEPQIALPHAPGAATRDRRRSLSPIEGRSRA